MWKGTSRLGLKFELKTVCYDAGECQRDQRRLQTRTLSVTNTRVRDKVVGEDGMGFEVLDVWEESRDGRLKLWVENAVCSFDRFDTRFGASECWCEQRRLQTHALSVTYARVRGQAVGEGNWRLGSCMERQRVWEGTSL